MKKLYNNNTLLIILPILISGLLVLNHFKYSKNEDLKYQNEHNSMFVEIANNMEKVQNVRMRKFDNTKERFNEPAKNNDVTVQKIDFTRNFEEVITYRKNNFQLGHFVVKYKNKFYKVHADNLDSCLTNYLNDYDKIVDLLANTKSYIINKDHSYTLKINEKNLKQYISTFKTVNQLLPQYYIFSDSLLEKESYKVIAVVTKDKLLASLEIIDMKNSNSYKIIFSKYNRTSININPAFLNKIETEELSNHN